MRFGVAAACAVAAGVSLAGCGAAVAVTTTTATPATQVTTTTAAPLPAGPTPSVIATMVCARKAQAEIRRVLGVSAAVTDRSWKDHRYSCRYSYPDGSFVLSVQELSSWAETLSYFRLLGTRLGDTGSLGNLGQGAFTASDGSIVVRKDWKVLLVNIAPLPAQFGRPPTSRADVAYTVAALILGCWDGD